MNFYQKLKETFFSVAPVMLLVFILSVTAAPLGSRLLLEFLTGGVLVIIGLTLFLLGVDIGILPVGERSGAALTSKKNLPLLLSAAFVIGFIVTVAEPDVQVLVDQVRGIEPSVSKRALIFAIAAGTGLFVMLGILRTILSIPLRVVLIISYVLVFGFAVFSPSVFQGIAFDSGGATTGPMTVPFILALGVGVAAVRKKTGSDKAERSIDEDDSFGLTAVASIGPVAAVIFYSFFLSKFAGSSDVLSSQNSQAGSALSPELLYSPSLFLTHIPVVAGEVFSALCPLAVMAVIFQFTLLKMPPMQVVRMVRGFIFSFAGLVIFLSGAQCGFMPAGEKLGELLGKLAVSGDKLIVLYNAAGEAERSLAVPGFVQEVILLLSGCIFGAVAVCAEPAVWVLTDQVEAVSGGIIRRSVLLAALSAGVSVSVGLSLLRILHAFSLWYILIPGYLLALVLTFFCPKLFTGIAFDSGGVASGPVTSTFILSFTLGAGASAGRGAASDAFGVIALVAMTPLIAIQILGIIFKVKTDRHKKAAAGLTGGEK